MRCCFWLLLLTMGCEVSAASADGGSASGLYRWTDAHGVVHFGDAVPASAASLPRAQLAPDGRIERVLPVLTSAQRARAAARRRALQHRRDYDRFLLQTYDSADDLRAARDQRLAQIGAAVHNAETIATRERAAMEKISAGTVRQDYIEALHHDQQAIDDLRARRQRVASDYAQDLARYHSLQRQHVDAR